jgi:hypothetical protein
MEINNNINNSRSELQGFIKINFCIKNLNSLIFLLRQFLKNEGYNMTKKYIDNLSIEVSNGEIDVKIIIKKELKETIISYVLINGNREDFMNFKKIMKNFNIKQ